MTCPKCSTKNPEDYSFCLSCGNQLQAVQQPLAPIPAYVDPKTDKRRRNEVAYITQMYEIVRKKMSLPYDLHVDPANPQTSLGMMIQQIDTETLLLILKRAKSLVVQFTVIGIIALITMVGIGVAIIYFAMHIPMNKRAIVLMEAELARRNAAQP